MNTGSFWLIVLLLGLILVIWAGGALAILGTHR